MSCDLNAVLAPWFKEYNAEIRSIAKELMDGMEKGGIDDASDWLHETIDGHEWVIYTLKARCVGIATDSPDACQDETGEPASSPEVAAFWSMYADVRDLVSSVCPDADWSTPGADWAHPDFEA